uniref:Guanine nucleotide-binding protein subunit beta-like protein n=1 Tax=Pyramimonas obovata TaxID=1411642 RepID=A0A7S0S0L2_9CHLO
MKLHIEVELSPEEMPLAKELLETLRTLTSHVKINSVENQTSAPPAKTQEHSRSIDPPTLPVIQPQQLSMKTPDDAQHGSTQLVQQPQEQRRAGPQVQLVPPQPVPQVEQVQMETLIRRLETENLNGPAIVEILMRLPAPETTSEATRDQCLAELCTAFVAVVFDPEMVMRHQSISPFMALLPAIPDFYSQKLRERLVHDAMKQLTVRRQLDAKRTDFFLHAEAFANLVQLKYVATNAMVRTVRTLLAKPDGANKCAAVTMLGKTVELCYAQLVEEADHNLEALRTDLMALEDCFAYDVEYICDSMGWPTQQAHQTGNAEHTVVEPISEAPAPAPEASSTPPYAAAVPPKGASLHPVSSYPGHTGVIFAIAVDDAADHLVSSGKDGLLLLRTGGGQEVQRMQIPQHYACAMDVDASRRALYACGVAKEGKLPPNILHFPLHQGQVGGALWHNPERISSEATNITCIKARPGEGFVTGETVSVMGKPAVTGVMSATSSGCQERVCFYDVNRGGAFGSLQPLQWYAEHTGILTCLSACPANPHMFLSAARDLTVRVWDFRCDRSVGMLGKPGGTGIPQAHEQLITCLDASNDNTVLSSSMDKMVAQWDLRSLGSTSVGMAPVATVNLDEKPVLKVAIGPSAHGLQAAVSTLTGLYLLDLSGSKIAAKPAARFADGRNIPRYLDIKWSHSRNTLYAAGNDGAVDVYTLM